MKLFVTAAIVALVAPTCKVGTSYEVFADADCKQKKNIKFTAGKAESDVSGHCIPIGGGSEIIDCSGDSFFTHIFPKPMCQGKEVSYQEFAFGKCTK